MHIDIDEHDDYKNGWRGCVCTMVANKGSGVNKKMLKNIYYSTLYEITTKCEINVEKK